MVILTPNHPTSKDVEPEYTQYRVDDPVYTCSLILQQHGETHSGYVAELPSCQFEGGTFEELLQNCYLTLRDTLSGILESGEPIPWEEPTTFSTFRVKIDLRDSFPYSVPSRDRLEAYAEENPMPGEWIDDDSLTPDNI